MKNEQLVDSRQPPNYEQLDQEYIDQYGMSHCESCGIHLENGVGFDEGKRGQYIYSCLGCGHSFDVASTNEVRKPAAGKSSVKNMELRPLVLLWLNDNANDQPVAELVNQIAVKFDISKANARYYVSRVWNRPLPASQLAPAACHKVIK
jgi:hypothetical protein